MYRYILSFIIIVFATSAIAQQSWEEQQFIDIIQDRSEPDESPEIYTIPSPEDEIELNKIFDENSDEVQEKTDYYKVKPRPVSSKDMGAKLRITDKTTARFEELVVLPDTITPYRDLEILVKRCWVDNAEYKPEHAVLLDIFENNSSSGKDRLFSGWLFSVSSAITSLEHPYFDVTMLACVPKQYLIDKKGE